MLCSGGKSQAGLVAALLCAAHAVLARSAYLLPATYRTVWSGWQPHVCRLRMAALMNPALKERGYGVLLHVDWDISVDLLSYLLTDAHQVHPWSTADQTIFFTPEFMTRAWMLLPLKSQAEVAKPEEVSSRAPSLRRISSPQYLNIVVSAELRARLQAQEEAWGVSRVHDRRKRAAAGCASFREWSGRKSRVWSAVPTDAALRFRRLEESTTFPQLRYSLRGRFEY